ncbi:microtubule-associated protein RP/EB family member 1 [Drosophila sechellia]|uniref:GM11276 n=1 Tax=Drosophila sechellia TaxID=7238 RepID=B4IDV5_DROSE|nr:microtubule-associated protein RP/EB family member 1 [Drosophila sechellia]EDW45763.1 GM11276 [Drosophila sechellia]
MTTLQRASVICSCVIRKWVNESLKTNIQLIEELASGAVYCQFIDMVFEGVMPLEKVVFATNRLVDFRRNFKILRKCLDELQIPLMVPIEKLIKRDFEANLYFAACFYSVFKDLIAIRQERVENYNPLAARKYQKFSMEPPTYVSQGTDVQNPDELDPLVRNIGVQVYMYKQKNVETKPLKTDV